MPPASLLSTVQSMPYPTLPKPASRFAIDRRLTLGGLAAAAVLLPMVIALLDSGDAMVEAMVEVMAVLESGGPSASVSVSLI